MKISCADQIGEVDNNAVIINELINNILIEVTRSSEEKMNLLLDEVSKATDNGKDKARIESINNDFASLNDSADQELISRLLIHTNDLWDTCGILSLKMIRNLWGYAAHYQKKATVKVYANAFSLLFSKENSYRLSKVVDSQINMLETFKNYQRNPETDSISETYKDYKTKYQAYLTAIGSDVKPRSMHILPWILEGVKLIFKPSGADNTTETKFYEILTRQAFINFMCDDFADQLRDERVVNVFSKIFPTQDKPTLSRKIILDGTKKTLSAATIKPYLQQELKDYGRMKGDRKLIEYLSFIWTTFYKTFENFTIL